MKLVIKIIHNNIVRETYDFSLNGFFYNGNEITVNNRHLKLLNLISYTKDWQENNEDMSDNGFYIKIEINNSYTEYFYKNEVPNNFNAFLYEAKRVLREEK